MQKLKPRFQIASPSTTTAPRRVVLVDLYWTRDKDPRVPLGHASLLAALRAAENIDVTSIVRAVNQGTLDPEGLADEILSATQGAGPGEVDLAFGAYVWAEDLLQRTLTHIRTMGFKGRIILGGPQISYSGDGLEALYPQVDAFVRGYGENALVRLVQSPGRPAVVGVHWAGEVDRGSQAAVNLELLPSPWLNGSIPLQGQRFVRWETQRGCPFRCNFCQHREAGARLKHKELHLARVRQELDLFVSHGVEDIAVLDPIFNNSRYANPILERFIERGFAGRLSLQCRAELCDESFLDLAAKLNTRLEFGLQTIHDLEQKAIDRNNNMPKVEAALAGTRARGINHELSMIYGLPRQTLRSFEESVAWCLEREVPVIKAFPLLLLRGTKLDLQRQDYGFETAPGPMGMVIRSGSFSTQEWIEMARLSEALKKTEGQHPRSLRALKAIARDISPDFTRFVAPSM